MRRGTTDTQTFTTPYEASTIAVLYVTYEQRGATILEKALGDSGLTVSDYEITVNLTQAETLLFSSNPTAPVSVQIRGVLTTGAAVGSNICEFYVCPILKDGEI